MAGEFRHSRLGMGGNVLGNVEGVETVNAEQQHETGVRVFEVVIGLRRSRQGSPRSIKPRPILLKRHVKSSPRMFC